jgi:hypothetical protein
MEGEPLDRLPEDVSVPLEEARAVIVALDQLMEELRASGHLDAAMRIDDVIGRMTRWVWPLLGELDREDGYDE